MRLRRLKISQSAEYWLTGELHVLRVISGPRFKTPINTVNRLKTLLEQVLRSTFAAIAVVAHHHNRLFEIDLLHKGMQAVIGEMKRTRRMTGLVTLWVANIDQYGILFFKRVYACSTLMVSNCSITPLNPDADE